MCSRAYPCDPVETERNARSFFEHAPVEYLEAILRALVYATGERDLLDREGHVHLTRALSALEEARRQRDADREELEPVLSQLREQGWWAR